MFKTSHQISIPRPTLSPEKPKKKRSPGKRGSARHGRCVPPAEDEENEETEANEEK